MAEHEPGDAASWSNRRGSERKKLIIDVRFEGGDGTGIANTRDIGSGGLYMTTTAPLDQGTPIMMTLSLGERTLNLNGVVAYSDPGHGVGVRFRNLTAEDDAFLRSELEMI
ncbi:MAG: PilZ domain-containing protein [Chloracidobacterium sp.]|nr:PilZ domain-containing protein [Chloracidobacterium sp.]